MIDDFSFVATCVGAAPDPNYPPTNIRLDMAGGPPRAATGAEVVQARRLACLRAARETKAAHWRAAWSQDAIDSAIAGVPTTGEATMHADRVALDLAWADYARAVAAAATVEAVDAVTYQWPTLVGAGDLL